MWVVRRPEWRDRHTVHAVRHDASLGSDDLGTRLQGSYSSIIYELQLLLIEILAHAMIDVRPPRSLAIDRLRSNRNLVKAPVFLSRITA